MNALESLIKDRIAASSPITFRDFMDMALYHPTLGYYCRDAERVGAHGDFYTSPATHPMFGALLALQLEQMWELLDKPDVFQVVEAGAGKGLLAQDILGYLPHLSPAFAGSLRYTAWEKQSAFAVPAPPGAASDPQLTSLPNRITGCILSNELLDALPVHRLVMLDGRLQEIYVTVKDGEFVEMAGSPSSPAIEQYLAGENVCMVEGQQAEINLEAARWVGQAGQRLETGFLLTIDYGDLAPDLYSPTRRQGTLMTYHRHMAGSNYYVNIGQQDITSHVDFSAVISAGFRAGLAGQGLISQGRFLENLGLKVFIQQLRRRGLSLETYLANRFAMIELARPEGFGNFKVLIQTRGLERVSLHGLTADNSSVKKLREQGHGLPVPLLREEHIPLLLAKYPHEGMTTPDLIEGE
ncbi:MAG: SAM-dependent methyltransferase [Chloroflexi bacterium]|nr:SAM-dependent methyltransferase [Chloroflexota bacterium]